MLKQSNVLANKISIANAEDNDLNFLLIAISI